jgi:hypothetical protein
LPLTFDCDVHSIATTVITTIWQEKSAVTTRKLVTSTRFHSFFLMIGR